jgi:flagellar biosynthesis protein FlhG
MSDQASELRRLVLRAKLPNSDRDSGLQTFAISGGKPGVGATTLAVNLAAALAADAQRVVLIDGDLADGNVAAHCGIPSGLNITDVLAGRKGIHEALQRGPGGMQILAGNAAAHSRNALADRSIQRLMRQMQSLGPHADCLLVDAGNRPSELTAQLWSASNSVLLVTTPEAAAVMDTYALIKTLVSRHGCNRSIGLIVNLADSAEVSADVHRRIDQSCRRFLGLSIEFVGAVPLDPACYASGDGPPEVVNHPAGPLALAIAELTQRIFELHQRQAIPRRLAA